MPDSLQQTLLWTATPTQGINDLANAGGLQTLRSISAAESHDGSDATFAKFRGTDDGFGPVDFDGEMFMWGPVTAAAVSGPISFVRIRARTSSLNTGPSAAFLWPVVGSTTYYTGPILCPGSATNGSADLAVNPATGLAWTNAAINATTLGAALRNTSADPNFMAVLDSFLYEWSIELWGPGIVTAPLDPLRLTQAVEGKVIAADGIGPLVLTQLVERTFKE
jgi:hypothetical protein